MEKDLEISIPYCIYLVFQYMYRLQYSCCRGNTFIYFNRSNSGARDSLVSDEEGEVMRVLVVGDVFSLAGCEFLKKKLPLIKREEKIDLIIVNGENSAEGNGITPHSANEIFAAGADVITGGNHTLRRKEFHAFLDENEFVLRPANFTTCESGKGYTEIDLGYTRVAVINLSGKIYFEDKTIGNPFICADELIERAKSSGIKNIFVDFHAEATSEKRALGFYLDGRVSAVFGTHTHVQTADEQILSKGTGYITDLGMTGVKNSVLGVRSEIIIERLKNNDMSKFMAAEGGCMLNGCIFDIDKTTGLAKSVKRIYIE